MELTGLLFQEWVTESHIVAYVWPFDVALFTMNIRNTFSQVGIFEYKIFKLLRYRNKH